MTNGKGKILVVGGGISGLTSALEASEAGYEVVLIEKEPTLGGRTAGLHQYFPKLCPPTCGLEINLRRLRPNPRVEVHTLTTLEAVTGEAGAYRVRLATAPRYVTESCVLCDKCTAVCPAEAPDAFNYGMAAVKAIHLPHRMAHPPRYVVRREHCPPGCAECVQACAYGAIDLEMRPVQWEAEVGSIILATGWKPYDANKLGSLGYGEFPDVISNVMMERLAAPDGPTGGRIVRPSNGEPVASMALVQCAGSRDENHLPYCSSICCLASLKHARYLRAANPESRVFFFYIDIRTPGKYEAFYSQTREDEAITFVKGKVAKVGAGEGGKVRVEAEDVLQGGKMRVDVDLVVLATGMQPNLDAAAVAGLPIRLDAEGFAVPQLQQPGIHSAGVAKNPVDVNSSIQDATGAALKAIQTLVEKSHGG